ncbi:addiction module toxin RelE [Candidatus Micrarchaeota archaeon]|nr:addiction module toxin RelE [Candidatus Micrarchaeota archaeon]
MFDFDLSDELREVLKVLRKKDNKMFLRIYNKIDEIVNCDENTINHYKNLKHDLKEYKRVHIGHFVLTFKVFPKKKYILFSKFVHHDDAYL